MSLPLPRCLAGGVHAVPFLLVPAYPIWSGPARLPPRASLYKRTCRRPTTPLPLSPPLLPVALPVSVSSLLRRPLLFRLQRLLPRPCLSATTKRGRTDLGAIIPEVPRP